MNLLKPILTKLRNACSNYRGNIAATPSLTPLECGSQITHAIREKKPLLVGRIGWMEGYAIGKLLSEGETPLTLREKLMQHAGIFPPTSEQLKVFSDVYLEAIKNSDILGLINAPYHGWLLKKYARQAALAELDSLEPYFSEEPWSYELQGKTVLVVHPFAESINRQYFTQREKIFVHPKMLPEFALKVIQAPQTITGNATEFASWFQTLKNLEEQIHKETFDVAIIGCGAYGLPLAAFVKSIGKIGIHLGGATQLLFGIRGWRWAEHPAFLKYRSIMTEAWSSPQESERPAGWEKIENGCYW